MWAHGDSAWRMTSLILERPRGAVRLKDLHILGFNLTRPSQQFPEHSDLVQKSAILAGFYACVLDWMESVGRVRAFPRPPVMRADAVPTIIRDRAVGNRVCQARCD